MNGSGNHLQDRVSKVQFLRISRWFTIGLCLVAFILPLPFGKPGVWSALGLVGLFSWQTILSGVLGCAVGLFVALLVVHWRPLQIIAEQIALIIAWETFLVTDHLATAFMASVGEELLFRGALQPLIGVTPMALIFGLLHATSVAHVVLAGVLGLCLGWLYDWTGSLWSPIAAHLALDLVTGLILARSSEPHVLPAQGD